MPLLVREHFVLAFCLKTHVELFCILNHDPHAHIRKAVTEQKFKASFRDSLEDGIILCE